MNTAVSALMILLNEIEAGAPQAAYETFVKLLAPFAPHMAAELAEKHSIDLSVWPAYDASKLIAETVTIAVQVNGKVRASIKLSPNASEDEALDAARAAAGKWLDAGEKKAIYIPGKIVSFVVPDAKQGQVDSQI